MSHWLTQIAASFSPGKTLLLAAVCDITGASPDGASGLLATNGEVVASNIINDRRRDLIAADAQRLLSLRQHWKEICYPLGNVLSTNNGNCRVVYQCFDTNDDFNWIREANTLIRRGSDCFVAFKKGDTDQRSTTIILTPDSDSDIYHQLSRQLKISAIEFSDKTIADINTKTTVIQTRQEKILLLPVRAPSAPVFVIGRHRVAIELIRYLALLPLRVNWIANQFSATDPTGPLVTRQSYDDMTIDAFPAASVVIIMTNDHKCDLAICKRALSGPTLKFIGCIGSAKKARLLKKQLLLSGIPEMQLSALQIPIGIPEITGKHPSFIAASAMAQILIVHKPDYNDQLTLFERWP